MAKDSGKKRKKKQKKLDEPPPSTLPIEPSPEAAAATKRSKAAKVVKKAKSAASKLSENPLVTEVVAAALVATAAAIKDPAKARKLAAAAGRDLQDAGTKASQKSELFWKLAVDIARRTLEAVGSEHDKAESSPAPKPKRSKPKA